MAVTAAAMNHDSYPDSYIRGILNTVKTSPWSASRRRTTGRAILRLNICKSAATA
jgi:hypothetical protein